MFAGADNGAIGFFDWKTGHKFQETATIAGPGSLESENGILLVLLTTQESGSLQARQTNPSKYGKKTTKQPRSLIQAFHGNRG